MTIQQANEESASESSLLTPQEQAICKQIAARRQTPHSQRALALLALNERCTQAQAAEQAGQSKGQVKYWVAKFRKQRLSIFPNTLLDEPGARFEVEPVAEIEEEPGSVTEKADPAGDTTKDTKGKKGKKARKKTKKTEKKTKKAKKEKKDKKKKKK